MPDYILVDDEVFLARFGCLFFDLQTHMDMRTIDAILIRHLQSVTIPLFHRHLCHYHSEYVPEDLRTERQLDKPSQSQKKTGGSYQHKEGSRMVLLPAVSLTNKRD